VTQGHWTHVGAVRASALDRFCEPVCAPLFCCQPARLAASGLSTSAAHGEALVMKVSGAFCHPRPRSLRCRAAYALPWWWSGARWARRNVEPVYSATAVFRSANPGVSRSLSIRW